MSSIYFAPLQSMTTFVYRNAHHRVFGPSMDKYYAPFLMAHEKRNFNFKEKNDLFPEHNSAPMVPQILTRDARDVLRYQQLFTDMGYEELNINLGCPSRTVTAKGRGSAFLIFREELDRFLDEVYSGSNGCRISVKTRIGTEDPEEFIYLTEIFNQYPISELIIHPRTMRQFYDGQPVRDSFLYALKYSTRPLVYNGDICSPEDWKQLQKDAEHVCPGRAFGLMLGRGAIADPALGRKIRGSGGDASSEEIQSLMHELIREYSALLQNEDMVIFRMKELWSWMIRLFPQKSRLLELLNHAGTIDEYLKIEDAILFQSKGLPSPQVE
ncbi:MAG: tRNA-dihydrouridine synthase [Lachnospiraceae bacterium]|nr:tRNA-dihydrouridine synthase [Lachnospiraceae bacterium]